MVSLLLLPFYTFSQNDIDRTCFKNDVLNNPEKNNELLEAIFKKIELPKVSIDTNATAIFLENGYSKYKILNPKSWLDNKSKGIPTEIDIIFTKYPKDKEFWQINYSQLLSNRLQALFALDPSLNDNRITWRMVLQTECDNEAQAKKLPHGFIIKMMPEKDDPAADAKQDSSYFQRQTQKVLNFIKQQGTGVDSSVLKIFDRHPEWNNSLVVMDWTGSMYKYGATAVLWHTLHQNQSGIKYFVFFNDGDDKKSEEKQIGNTGGIYGTESKYLTRVINLFYTVMAKGSGGDTPENNIEAVLTGQALFPNFKELILIADNKACIKDYRLIDSLKVPVKVILCGTENGINPQYINLAYKTKGSIHTIEEDIYEMIAQTPGSTFTLNGVEYELNEFDHFEPSKAEMANNYTCDEYYSDEYIDFKNKMKQDSLYFKKLKTKTENFIYYHGGIKDSMVYKFFRQHNEITDALVISDFTKGMYNYSAQSVLYHIMHLNKSNIKYFTLFNDGDAKRERKKKLGAAGGVYIDESKKIQKVVNSLYRIPAKGNGGDNEDNLVEAINKSTKKFNNYRSIVVIADNNSCIRDFQLLDTTRTNIHILLCQTQKGVNPQFLNLADKLNAKLYFSYNDKPIELRKLNSFSHNGYNYQRNKLGYFEYVKTKQSADLPYNCDKYYSNEYYKYQKKAKSIFERIF
ncbi:MAG: hypothetical protein V4667_04525 [Bacteroidota bacterium]